MQKLKESNIRNSGYFVISLFRFRKHFTVIVLEAPICSWGESVCENDITRSGFLIILPFNKCSISA